MDAKVLPTYVVEPMEAMGGAITSSAKTIDQTAKIALGIAVKIRGFVQINAEDVKQLQAQDKLFATL